MRHGKKINHLGRKTAHRQALLSNLASSLILHKRITTTVAKAKALRKYVEPLLTKSKEDTTHSRRVVFSYLGNKESVKALFGEVASKIADRPGGYTRIIKLAETRLGDNAEVCLMELVDFNTLYTKESVEKKAKTRRGRGKKKEDGEVEASDEAAPKKEAKPKAEKAPKKAAPKKEKK
jgi:large subunit ribosomal protein L17